MTDALIVIRIECQSRVAKLRGLRCRFRCALGIDADELALAALVLELNEAFDQCKKRIVFAPADIIARLPLRAALAGKDIAAKHMLAAEFLKAETLCS